MKNEFLNMAGGSAVPIINKTSFSEINILMPDMYILNKILYRVQLVILKE